MPGKRVCVIGAGMAGLVTLKECKNVGLDPVCYEINADVGGIWTRDRDCETSNSPRAWDNLVTNTSKYIMTFSDYQPVPDTPQFMTWAEYGDYYSGYAEHFQLMKHIQFNTRVLKVTKTPDHAQTGRWEVYICPLASFRGGDKRPGLVATQEELDRCTKEVFDYVLVAAGFFKIPNYPDIPGIDSFPGIVQHSFDYKSADPYRNKKVLVVGNSFSAGDIACDISLSTQEPVQLSLGKGTWIWPRVLPGGFSIDRGFNRNTLYRMKPDDVNKFLIDTCQNRLDVIGSGFNPPLPPFQSAYIMGDDIYLKILTGKVRILDQLIAFNGSTAEFKSGARVTGVEAVVFATGYKKDVSFVDLDIVADNGKCSLYHMMLPVNEKHHTIAFMGFYGGDSPIAPPTELQARYMARLISGQMSVPSREVMEKNVQALDDMALARKGQYSYHLPLFVVGDMIAQEMGVYPSFWRILLRDPTLAFQVWYGPIFSAQYRLLGPGSDWETARAVCYRAQKVLTAVACTRGLVERKVDSSSCRWRLSLLAGGVAACAGVLYASRSGYFGDFRFSDILKVVGIEK